jgi:hypothetical protein
VSQTKAQLLEGKTDQDVNAKTIALAGATSGTATISATAIAGTPTLTLPSASGTIDRLNRAGNILQVVQASYSTEITSSSSTFADTGLTATITPTSSSSKVLVLVNQNGCGKETNDTYYFLRLLRDSTVILNIERFGAFTNSILKNWVGSSSSSFLDSPATTSATTYKTQFASGANNAVVYMQTGAAGATTSSTITLMEVAA